MRWFVFASLLSTAAILGACSAADDFGKFKFADDGGASSGDLSGGDMSGGDLAMSSQPGFGEACTDVCAPGNPLRPLMCYKMFGTRMVPGGECTRTCTPGSALSCSDYTDAVCATVESTNICLRACDPSLGRNCRTGFSCCAGQMVVTGPGACAPTNTDYCGH